MDKDDSDLLHGQLVSTDFMAAVAGAWPNDGGLDGPSLVRSRGDEKHGAEVTIMGEYIHLNAPHTLLTPEQALEICYALRRAAVRLGVTLEEQAP